MAKRLNKSVIVGLTIAGMAVTMAAGVVLLLSLPKRDPQPFVQKAEEAQKRGDFENATKFYQTAYSRARGNHDPKASEYLLRAGEAALAGGNARVALSTWRTVVLNEPTNVTAQEHLVNFFLETAELDGTLQAWSQVQQEAEALVAAAQKSGGTSYLGSYARGMALLAQRATKPANAEEGKKCLLEAVKGDKSNPDYAQALANYYLGLDTGKDPAAPYVKDAATVLETLVANPSSDVSTQAKAYLYRGQFYADPRVQAAKQAAPDAEKRAIADFEKAIQLQPASVDAFVGLGDYWHNLKIAAARKGGVPDAEVEGYNTKAKDAYDRGIKADPDHYAAYLQLAQMYAEDNRLDDALQVIKARLDRPIKRDHYLAWRNRSYMAHLRNVSFKLTLAKLGPVIDKNLSGEEYNKAVQPIQQQLEQIYKETVADLPSGAEHPIALTMSGRLWALKNEPQQACRALEKALKLSPGNAELMRILAGLYARTGSPGLAEELLQQVINSSPALDIEALAALALVKVQIQKPEEALAVADRVLQVDPKNQAALEAKLQAYQQQQNLRGIAEVRKLMPQVAAAKGDKVTQATTLILEAEGQETRDTAKLAQAERLLREALVEDPLNAVAIQNLIRLIMINDPRRAVEAVEVLNTAKAAADKERAKVAATQPDGPRNTELGALLTRLELLRITVDPKVPEAEKFARREEAIKRESDPLIRNLDLFQLYRGSPDHRDQAYSAIQEAAKLKPDDPAIVGNAFETAIYQQDWKMVDALLERGTSLGLDPSGGHLMRAQMLLSRRDVANNYAEAAREARAGLEKLPNSSEGYALLGRAQLATGSLEEAQRSFEQAAHLNPLNGTAAVGLAMLASTQNRDPKIREAYLAQASRLAPNHPWVASELQSDQDRRDRKKGIARREEIRRSDPRNLENLLNLAELYSLEDRPDEARKTYEEARKLEPANLKVAERYAGFLLTRKPPEAKPALEMVRLAAQAIDAKENARRAAAQLLLAGVMQLALEKGVSDVGKLEDLDAAYMAAAKIHEKPEITVPIGDFFMRTGRPKLAEEWFRKSIALSDKGSSERKPAYKMLMQVLIRAMGPQQAPEVQKELDTFAREYPEEPTTLLFQAEVDLAAGRDDDAVKAYSDFIQKQPTSGTGYLRRALAYARRSQWDAAIKDLTEVKRLQPSNASARIELASALENSGINPDGSIDRTRQDLAIAELQSLVQDQPDNNAAVEQLFGTYLKLKRYDSAADLIAAGSKRAPDLPVWDTYRLHLAASRGDAETALKHAGNAVEKSKQAPENVDALLRLQLAFGRFDDVISFAGKLDEKLRADGAVLLRVGSAYLRKQDYNHAAEYVLRALSSAGDRLRAFVQLVAGELARPIDANALAAAVEARMNANQSEARAGKIVLVLLNDRQSKADVSLKLLSELIETSSPGNPREKLFLTQQLAQELYAAKKYDQARAAYQQALQIEPNDPVTLNNLAYLLIDQFNDPKAALPFARRAVDIAPDDNPETAGVLDTLGWNLVLMGEYDQGIYYLNKAIDLKRRLAAVHYHLAEALQRRSEKPAARDKAAEVERARMEVVLAHKLVMQSGADPEGLLPQIAGLGEKLGLPPLAKELPKVTSQPMAAPLMP